MERKKDSEPPYKTEPLKDVSEIIQNCQHVADRFTIPPTPEKAGTLPISEVLK